MTTIQLKLSSIRGRGGMVADKDEDTDAEKYVNENKDLMRDN